jgi:hypothetical protein
MEQFQLSHETTYDQFVYAVRSKQVPLQNEIPNSYPKLNCKFTRETNDNDHRLHLHCADEIGIILWPLRQFKDCISVEDMIQSLIAEKEEWWC